MNITWWGKSDSHTLEKLFWFRSVLIVVQVATSLLAKYVFSVSFGVLGVSTIIAILILVNEYTWTHS